MAEIFGTILVSVFLCCVTIYLTSRSTGKLIDKAGESGVQGLNQTAAQAIQHLITAIRTDGEQTRAAITANGQQVVDAIRADGEQTRAAIRTNGEETRATIKMAFEKRVPGE